METQQQLQKLRALQKQLSAAQTYYDRFGRQEHAREIEALEAQIQAIPQAVRDLAYCDDIRNELTYLVESYLIARAARFMDDPLDLKAALLRLVDQPDPLIKGNLRLERIAQGLSALRRAETLSEDLDIAIELAHDFNLSREQIDQRYQVLERFAREYLDDRARFLEAAQPKGLGKLFGGNAPRLDEPDDLLQAVRQWEALIPEFRAQPDDVTKTSTDPATRVRLARQRLFASITALRFIGAANAEIDQRLSAVQAQWQPKRPK